MACGDSFAAGFLLGYLRNASIEATTLLSNAVGAGTAMGMTLLEKIAHTHTHGENFELSGLQYVGIVF